jgi:hypothetical protein
MLRTCGAATIGFLLFLGVLTFAGAGVFAQTGQGILTGSITDPTGAIIAGVQVKVTNQNTNFVYTAVTTQEGIYRVPYLNVGTYEVTYQAPGFKRLTRRDIPIHSSETLGLDVTMEVGNVVETVEVTGRAQLLETETASTGHLVSGQELTTLPTPQMKIESMLWYVSGVTSQSGNGHAAGGRSRAFQFNADGVSGNVIRDGALSPAGSGANTAPQFALTAGRLASETLNRHRRPNSAEARLYQDVAVMRDLAAGAGCDSSNPCPVGDLLDLLHVRRRLTLHALIPDDGDLQAVQAWLEDVSTWWRDQRDLRAALAAAYSSPDKAKMREFAAGSTIRPTR